MSTASGYEELAGRSGAAVESFALDDPRADALLVLASASQPTGRIRQIDRLVELSKLLLTVLHRLDESSEQFRELAKRDTSGFWL
jgi:hypothetical protein